MLNASTAGHSFLPVQYFTQGSDPIYLKLGAGRCFSQWGDRYSKAQQMTRSTGPLNAGEIEVDEPSALI